MRREVDDTIPMTSLMNDDDLNMELISVGDFCDQEKMKLNENCCRFTNLKVKDGLTELSLPKIQTDMLKDYDRQVFFASNTKTKTKTC